MGVGLRVGSALEAHPSPVALHCCLLRNIFFSKEWENMVLEKAADAENNTWPKTHEVGRTVIAQCQQSQSRCWSVHNGRTCSNVRVTGALLHTEQVSQITRGLCRHHLMVQQASEHSCGQYRAAHFLMQAIIHCKYKRWPTSRYWRTPSCYFHWLFLRWQYGVNMNWMPSCLWIKDGSLCLLLSVTLS